MTVSASPEELRSKGRACRKCGADEWRARKRGGFVCAACNRAACAKYSADDPERRRAATARYRAANRTILRARSAKYYTANSGKVLAIGARWARNNPDKVRASGVKYYAKNGERLRAVHAKYRAANPEKVRERTAKYRAENPEKARAASARWKGANPDKRCAHKAKRRALKLNAPGRGVTAAQWRKILDGSLGICAYCNERRPLTMDHIEPLALGGEHDIDNITAACGPCNCSKCDTPLLLWLAKKRLAREAA